MRTLAALAVLLLVAACQTAPPEMTEAEIAQIEAEVAQAISDRWAGYRDALLRGDPEEITAFWTSDAHLYEPGMNMTGAELSDFFQTAFETVSVSGLQSRRMDLYVHGEVAYEIGEADETVQAEGGESETRQLYFFFRWEKEDGVWKMDRLVAGPREALPQG